MFTLQSLLRSCLFLEEKESVVKEDHRGRQHISGLNPFVAVNDSAIQELSLPLCFFSELN